MALAAVVAVAALDARGPLGPLRFHLEIEREVEGVRERKCAPS